MNRLLSALLLGLLIISQGNAAEPTIILGRPTAHSIAVSVRFPQTSTYRVVYGLSPETLASSTPWVEVGYGVSRHTPVEGLEANSRYFYRVQWTEAGSSTERSTTVNTFVTQRATGTTYRFAIEADEHLYDKKGIGALYERTISNIATDSADFLLSLGDTFGDDHTPDETTSADMDSLHRVYLRYLHPVCSNTPFFFCLGNHEGENGFYLKDSTPDNIAVYGTLWRKAYYPNPYPDGFYSGNQQRERHDMELPENYYAWTWGDALFVVLDVYRHCDVDEKPKGWDWTLGVDQYMWLRNTLASSTAKYRFVFAHHTRGQGRGGILTARGYEWGGWEVNKDLYEFPTKRPGWEAPIHELFKRYGVTAFFQGHDHLYAREELDGIVYQTVPMPSDSTYEIGVLANADAFDGLTLNGSGHLRVTVAPDEAAVEFVRAYMPSHENGDTRRNGEVAYRYTMRPRVTSVNESGTEDDDDDSTLIDADVFDLMGRFVTRTSGQQSVRTLLQPGLYLVRQVHERTVRMTTLMVER